MPTLTLDVPLYEKKRESNPVQFSFDAIPAGMAVSIQVDYDTSLPNNDLVAAIQFATERMIKAIHKSEITGY